jgi:hypothetical protein
MRTGARISAGRPRPTPLLAFAAAFFFLLVLSPFRSLAADGEPGSQRTIRLKIVVDEEYRRLPGQSLLEIKRTVAASARFFKKHFGLSLSIQGIGRWHSDNTKWTLPGLCDDLYGAVGRGDCDIVIGFSGQIRGESRVFGVASYDQGYILVKRSLNPYVSKTILTHELCHVFGAVDLEGESSIMNEDNPEFECDDFTKQIIRLHRNRRFGPGVFPLSPEDQETAISLYEQRKSLRRQEAGLSLRLAAIYLEKRDSEMAIKECLEAERLAPWDPAVRTFLELAYRQKEKVGSASPFLPVP